MAWVAVDKDGTEKIFSNCPIRRCSLIYMAFGLITSLKVKNAYTKNQRNKWSACWSTSAFDPLPEGCIILPKGTIEKLIGRKLTWKDEPVELKDSY